MKFNDLLNKYITEIGCTAKELSEVSGLSAAALSRYRTGERVPGKEQLAMLIDGLVSLAEKNERSERKEQADVSEAGREIREAFKRYTDEADFDYEQFTANLNTLISAFDISTSELSRALSFDPSYISRIRLGQRRPSDREGFIEGICRFVVNKKYSEDTARMLAELTGCDEADLATDTGCMDVLREWLSSGSSGGSDPVGSFLRKFDDFGSGRIYKGDKVRSAQSAVAAFSAAGIEELLRYRGNEAGGARLLQNNCAFKVAG